LEWNKHWCGEEDGGDVSISAEILTDALSRQQAARFYKCALQVNPYSYAKYRGWDAGDETLYNKALVEACLAENIDVVGLANHGDTDSSLSLKIAFEEVGITAFPGLEISSTEKIHLVSLFPPDVSPSRLNQVIGALQGGSFDENKTIPSQKSATEILQIVAKERGVCFAAHCTSDSGILQLRQNHIWQKDILLAAQIPGSIEKLEAQYKQIILNQTPDYQRSRPIAVINAKDIATPEDIRDRRASCFIKMTEPSIDALRMAFLDADSRIRLADTMNTVQHSRITAMAVEGGRFLDDFKVHFSDNLNTFVGGRGTGKSTILEALRYALGLEAASQQARNAHQGMIKSNLENARILLRVVSEKHGGNEYTVERIVGQSPVVYDSTGNRSSLLPSDLLPGIEIYGQNEILDIANAPDVFPRIIARFMDAPPTTRKTEILLQLKENRQKSLELINSLDNAQVELNQLEKLQEQFDTLKQFGIQEKQERIEQLDKEKAHILNRANEDHADIQKRYTDFIWVIDIPFDLQYLSEEAIKDSPNADAFRVIRGIFEVYQLSVRQAFEPVRAAHNLLNKSLHLANRVWKEVGDAAEEELRQAINKLQADKKAFEAAKSVRQLSQRIAAVQALQRKFTYNQNELGYLFMMRDSLVKDLDNARRREIEHLQTTLKRLNKRLEKQVRLGVLEDKNRQVLHTFLKSLHGLGDKTTEWVHNAPRINVPILIEQIRAGVECLLLRYKDYGMTESIASILVNMGDENILKLQEITTDYEITIELNVGTATEPDFKSIHDLSTGQKCTAILHILLLENPDPLILDQPEDNLDNAFIAERIVEQVRKMKTERQFIFATHNANIPVFGDAEWLAVLEATSNRLTYREEYIGSIDKPSVQAAAARILEGGKEAFMHRREKYGY
jgi:energy-coupling factor transporter ATP-binding protein EcfA2